MNSQFDDKTLIFLKLIDLGPKQIKFKIKDLAEFDDRDLVQHAIKLRVRTTEQFMLSARSLTLPNLSILN